VRDGVDGVIVPAGDPVAFADGVQRCIAELAGLAAGAATVTERWDDVARAVEELRLRR
jgi:hypothetical protein